MNRVSLRDFVGRLTHHYYHTCNGKSSIYVRLDRLRDAVCGDLKLSGPEFDAMLEDIRFLIGLPATEITVTFGRHYSKEQHLVIRGDVLKP